MRYNGDRTTMIEVDPLSLLMGGLAVYMWLTNDGDSEGETGEDQ